MRERLSEWKNGESESGELSPSTLRLAQGKPSQGPPFDPWGLAHGKPSQGPPTVDLPTSPITDYLDLRIDMDRKRIGQGRIPEPRPNPPQSDDHNCRLT